ncbi:hypothetical protein P7D22_22125 [Lichenihabitans sp. Uapishka_5]|uniref:hypothetical protein n=1 Tax=Lichenihabitans sp. Uapishka_5 TaxID=3037302 RepID=UPI0029E81F2A|nr:hypothetical protein [Lichenihabitans sp. Uapishka_5]MDX7953856.1 hypothetical protein [Lichenihabitans sp. Uapishka_5]
MSDHVPAKASDRYDIPVEIVFDAFARLAANERQVDFCKYCQDNGLTLAASATLIAYAKSILKELPEAKTRPTQECPDCPTPGN